MVLFPFHWTTQFKYLLVAFPRSELLGHFCQSLGALLCLAAPQSGGPEAALLSGEALVKKLHTCLAGRSWQRAH